MVLSKILAIMQDKKLITVTVSRKIGTLLCKFTICIYCICIIQKHTIGLGNNSQKYISF